MLEQESEPRTELGPRFEPEPAPEPESVFAVHSTNGGCKGPQETMEHSPVRDAAWTCGKQSEMSRNRDEHFGGEQIE